MKHIEILVLFIFWILKNIYFLLGGADGLIKIF